MKIAFTGGGTGGHFYPIIAVAEAVREEARDKKILQPELYYMGPSKYNPRALFDTELVFIPIPAGKIRRYFSLLNITDVFKTCTGIISAGMSLFHMYPDVVFGKGGYASFPTLFAARLLRIPVVIHESDSKPGRVNAWASKFATRIAISYPEAGEYFKKRHVPEGKIAFTGNPIRREIIMPLSNRAREYLNIEETTPVILIIGGSQGSKLINNTVIDAIPELVKKYVVIHQTGKNNFKEVSETVSFILKDNAYAHRYKPIDYLNDLTLRSAAGIASLIVSRAGSSIFEIAAWGIPSIIVPLSQKISHDQMENAFAYARAGGCSVIEEENLTSHILISEIDRVMNSHAIQEKMKAGAKNFAHIDSAKKIARVLVEIALEHQS